MIRMTPKTMIKKADDEEDNSNEIYCLNIEEKELLKNLKKDTKR